MSENDPLPLSIADYAAELAKLKDNKPTIAYTGRWLVAEENLSVRVPLSSDVLNYAAREFTPAAQIIFELGLIVVDIFPSRKKKARKTARDLNRRMRTHDTTIVAFDLDGSTKRWSK